MTSKNNGSGFLTIFLGCLLLSAITLAETHSLGLDSGLRKMRYNSRSPEKAIRWQKEVRSALINLLKVDDLISKYTSIPFDRKIILEEEKGNYLFREIEFHSTKGRRIPAILTIPHNRPAPYAAVVCIHGHGGSRYSVHEQGSLYKGFATALAESGFITVAVDVGQHEVYEQGRTLMGERLWDLMRCVDLLASLEEVDKTRIGCAGLSLGGEMAMWLAALDTRISAAVSSGFLTFMDQLEHNHCMCWKFEGLRELVDFADIYSLIAPRPLMCQNGLQEGPKDFYVPIAQKAMEEITAIFEDLRRPENVILEVHEGGHEIDLPSLLEFFRLHLVPESSLAINRQGKHLNTLASSTAQMNFVENKENGWLTLKDGQVDVLTYRFGDQLKEGIDPEQTRSCYIHPLFSLDGKPLTDDFPADHPHHHGLSWTWPFIRTRGQETQTWHPANLRQYFQRWLKREIHEQGATLSIEIAWKLNGEEVVAKEVVTLLIHPADESSRIIDLELTIEAVGGPLELRGTLDENKGYGGLTIRGAPEFKGLPLLTDQGEFTGEPNNLKLRWADLSSKEAGVAIFVSRDHPDFPASWVLRTSYAGLINVSWPGLETVLFHPGKPISLRYRLNIHRSNMTPEEIDQAYKRYLSEQQHLSGNPSR